MTKIINKFVVLTTALILSCSSMAKADLVNHDALTVPINRNVGMYKLLEKFNLSKTKKKKKKSKLHMFDPLKVVTRPMAYITTGIASWYGLGDGFQGARTASGVRFNTYDMVAANRYLPFGTIVKVVNLANLKSVLVKIVDRGPFTGGRIIDLSYAAKTAIGMGGMARVALYATK